MAKANAPLLQRYNSSPPSIALNHNRLPTNPGSPFIVMEVCGNQTTYKNQAAR